MLVCILLPAYPALNRLITFEQVKDLDIRVAPIF